jgi:demethylmenaquinone methyltransferase/2-methoxy-6-polyprenyl-1,4-benzoquinol methylase
MEVFSSQLVPDSLRVTPGPEIQAYADHQRKRVRLVRKRTIHYYKVGERKIRGLAGTYADGEDLIGIIGNKGGNLAVGQKPITQGKPLHGMFSAVPPKYDLVNSVITLNMDKRWRRLAAKECLAAKPGKVLDLCCGTGDLAITLARMADYPVETRGLDFSRPMLEVAENKAARLVGLKKIRFSQGDASKMPFPDAYFDSIGISFGFRNLTYKNPLVKEHLAEILRVLKPGGRFVIVESSQPSSKPIRRLFRVYLLQFVYRAGTLLSGNKKAYHYLAESVAGFYSSEELIALLTQSGFKTVSYRPLFFGAAGIHVAIK